MRNEPSDPHLYHRSLLVAGCIGKEPGAEELDAQEGQAFDLDGGFGGPSNEGGSSTGGSSGGGGSTGGGGNRRR